MTASFDSDVSVTVEAAFGSDPLAVPVWTDITAYVRQFSTERGRSHVLDEMQAGVATLVLSNNDSRFDPSNTTSPYTPNVRVFTPVRIRATHSAVTYDLYRGFATGWPQSYPAFKDSIVVLNCVDAFRLMAMHDVAQTESSELAGTRVGNLLDTMSWPAGWRDVDAGHITVAALGGERATVLEEIQRAVIAENGLFWIAGDGDATFRDGLTRIEDDTLQATFSDDGADLEYVEIQVDYDDAQLWNAATVTRVNGVAQTSTDSTSIGDYGRRDVSLGETIHGNDGEASTLADWIVLEHKDIRPRVSMVAVKPGGDPANLWPAALGLEILDKVNVERTPPSGTTVDVDCYIEGVAHTVTMVGQRSWVTSFQLSPDLPHADWWVLGTSELGTDTRLAY